MIGLLLGLSKGYFFTPWRSPYLLWRIETYSGIEASSITPAIFWKFVWDNKWSLLRYMRWGAEQRAKFLGLIFVFAFASTALAEVVDSSAAGFTVRHSFQLKAPPAMVYARLIRNVGDWWDPDHTFSGNSYNLGIDDKPMGCFCEKLPGGGGVRHLEVVYVDPGKTIRMIGALGPLQALAANGTITITLKPVEGGTQFDMKYSVAGYLPVGMSSWAGPVDGMLKGQFDRFKLFVETGKPVAK